MGLLSPKYSKAWHIVLIIKTISAPATSDFGPSFWAAKAWMIQQIVLIFKIKRQQIQDSVDALPRSVGGLWCGTGQVISSHHLCTPSGFFPFDTCGSWTLSYFLSVQNIAQSSPVLVTVAYILEKRRREAFFSGCCSVFPLHSREYCGQVDMKFGNGQQEKGLFSK